MESAEEAEEEGEGRGKGKETGANTKKSKRKSEKKMFEERAKDLQCKEILHTDRFFLHHLHVYTLSVSS